MILFSVVFKAYQFKVLKLSQIKVILIKYSRMVVDLLQKIRNCLLKERIIFPVSENKFPYLPPTSKSISPSLPPPFPSLLWEKINNQLTPGDIPNFLISVPIGGIGESKRERERERERERDSEGKWIWSLKMLPFQYTVYWNTCELYRIHCKICFYNL